MRRCERDVGDCVIGAGADEGKEGECNIGEEVEAEGEKDVIGVYC